MNAFIQSISHSIQKKLGLLRNSNENKPNFKEQRSAPLASRPATNYSEENNLATLSEENKEFLQEACKILNKSAQGLLNQKLQVFTTSPNSQNSRYFLGHNFIVVSNDSSVDSKAHSSNTFITVSECIEAQSYIRTLKFEKGTSVCSCFKCVKNSKEKFLGQEKKATSQAKKHKNQKTTNNSAKDKTSLSVSSRRIKGKQITKEPKLLELSPIDDKKARNSFRREIQQIQPIYSPRKFDKRLKFGIRHPK